MTTADVDIISNDDFFIFYLNVENYAHAHTLICAWTHTRVPTHANRVKDCNESCEVRHSKVRNWQIHACACNLNSTPLCPEKNFPFSIHSGSALRMNQ